MLKKCAWCGSVFDAERSTARFCGGTCRQSWNRAKKGGMRLAPMVEPPEPPRRTITDNEIAAAVTQARGSAAALDAASARGPKDKRDLCAKLAAGITSLLGEVGL